MSGSVLFAVIATVILFLVGIFMSPWFIIPAVMVLLFVVMATPLMALFSGRGRPSGAPTTREASYDPVTQPERRSAL
jgi:multisubunit Na+/H+ antiporter MnhG subunit